jgi:hypothetical protein
MRRRSPLPQRDHAAHRAEWRQLAQRALAAIDDDDLDGEERRALGDLAAMARNAWIYPCPAPEGALAACLAWNTLAWSRQGSPETRLQLRPVVRILADCVLIILTALEAREAIPAKVSAAAETYARPLRERADIDG